MAEMILRFYGRFVVADVGSGSANGMLRILALNVKFNPDVPADPHRLLMAAPRRTIRKASTTHPPDIVVMQPGEDADRGELALWELAGLRLTPQLSGGFAWETPPTQPNDEGAVLADLNALSPGTNLNPQHFDQFGEQLPVVLVIDIRGGTGSFGVVENARASFLPLAEAQTLTQEGFNQLAFDTTLAEFVEVIVTLPNSAPNLAIDITRNNGSTRTLGFITDPDEPTMLTFTNLCASEGTSIDAEFAASYDVLQAPPPVPERPVPVVEETEGRQFPCFKPAFVRL